jgi:hypothetical protein
MDGIFAEFENENSLRSYPFAEGCVPPGNDDAVIPAGVFVDAAIYPVNPSGVVYLSEISETGVFRISDSSGVIMEGTAEGNKVEFFDLSGLGRHVGTLVSSSAESLSEFSGRGSTRKYSSSNTSFASSCVFPVVIDGVTSISVGESSKTAGSAGFSNSKSDDIRVSSATKDGLKTLRFDVLPRPGVKESESIRRIICVVDGQTPFRIKKLTYVGGDGSENIVYNTIVLSLENLDMDTVCSSVHRENHFEMSDTCKCEKDPLPEEDSLPDFYQLEEVFIPPDEETGQPEGGIPEGADNAFYIVVPNIMGEGRNPISITLEDGVVSPKTEDLKVVVQGDTADLAEGEMLDDVTSKGVVIQVPGLSGGNGGNE